MTLQIRSRQPAASEKKKHQDLHAAWGYFLCLVCRTNYNMRLILFTRIWKNISGHIIWHAALGGGMAAKLPLQSCGSLMALLQRHLRRWTAQVACTSTVCAYPCCPSHS